MAWLRKHLSSCCALGQVAVLHSEPVGHSKSCGCTRVLHFRVRHMLTSSLLRWLVKPEIKQLSEAKTVRCFEHSERIADNMALTHQLGGRKLVGMCRPENANTPRNFSICVQPSAILEWLAVLLQQFRWRVALSYIYNICIGTWICTFLYVYIYMYIYMHACGSAEPQWKNRIWICKTK